MLKIQKKTRNRFNVLCDLLNLNRLEIVREALDLTTEDLLKKDIQHLLSNYGLHSTKINSSISYIFKLSHQFPVLITFEDPETEEELMMILVSKDLKKTSLYIHSSGIRKVVHQLTFKEFQDITGKKEYDTVDAIWTEPTLVLDTLKIPEGKYNKEKKPWIRFKKLLKLEHQEIKSLVIYAIASGVMSLAWPLAVQTLVNIIAFGTLIQPLIILSLALLGVLLLGALIRVLQIYALEYLERNLFIQLTIDFSRRLPRLDTKVDDSYRPTELVNRFFDIVTIQKSLAVLLLDGLDILLQTSLGLLLLAFYHPALLAFDVILIFGIFFSLQLYYKTALKTSIDESNTKYQIAAFFEEMVGAFTLFKTKNALRYAYEYTQTLSNTFLSHRESHFQAILYQIIGLTLIQIIASVGLLGLGGFLVIQGTLSLGQLVAAELVVTIVVGGLTKLARKVSTYYDLLASLEKLGKLVDFPLEPELIENPNLENHDLVGCHLQIEKLSFDPKIAGVWRDHIVSLEVHSGQIAGILVQDRVPSSPLLDVLFGLRDIESGDIKIDGIRVHERSMQVRTYACLLRSPEWIAASILSNLEISQESKDLDAVEDVLIELDLWDDLSKLRDEENKIYGVNYLLDAQGDPLDSNQQIMLAIARVILSKPRLVMIDGMLDAVNLKQAEIIFKALKKRHITVLMSSNQPHLFKFCDDLYKFVDQQGLVKTNMSSKKESV
jgi:ABC-type bacteriocin/lantibiotic exporter with double-glycine peptidase domain